MAISDTIQSMYENVGEVYDTITNVTLPEHKNIENIPRTIRDSYLEIINNGINVIYDNWEKVTGEGTSLTLTPTEEAPMQIKYKGNTNQETTTGKQLFQFNSTNYVENLATTLTGTGENFTITSTSYGVRAIYVCKIDFQTLYAYMSSTYKTYSIAIYATNSNSYVDWASFTNDRTEIKTDWNILQTNSISLSNYQDKYLWITLRGSNSDSPYTSVTYENFILSKTNVNSYEKYSGGIPAPNPDFPMDIHVVSGDNSIEVCGKNLFSGWTKGKGIRAATGEIIDNTTGAISDYILVNFNTNPNYYISGLDAHLTSFIAAYNSSNQFLGRTGGSARSEIGLATYSFTSGTPQGTGDIAYIIVYQYKQPSDTGSIDNLDTMPTQLEIGSQATTYEPYTGASYPINLPVENLVNINGTSRSVTNNYYITEPLNKEITSDMVGKKYSLSFKLKVNTLPSNVGFYYNIGYGATGMTAQIKSISVSSPSATTYNCKLEDIEITQAMVGNNLYFRPMGYSTQQTFSYEFSEVQLEEGSKANHYTPYGTTPIWLGWIPNTTYQDKIDKSTGKNLLQFDNENNPSRSLYTYTTERPERITCTKNTTGNDFYAQYIAYLEEGKTYTLSVDDDTNRNIYMYSDRLWGTAISGLTNKNAKYGTPFTFTSPYTGIAYIGFFGGGTQTLTMPMLNEGSTALPYEPYGTGWYLKKEIGKVILNGSSSENWSSSVAVSTSGLLNRAVNTDFQNTNVYMPNSPYMSDIFKYIGNNGTLNVTEEGLYNTSSTGTSRLYVWIDKERLTESTTSAFRTFLSNNPMTIYYILTTPTYTLIEGELLNQLEAIKMSYEGQTNISQDNNDLPFILNPSALKKV